MGIKERKERDRENMQALILETALELFTTEGFESMTLRRIAERIEYSAATIYLYFKDKDDIFFALLRQGFDMLLDRQNAVQSIVDPRERLHAHGRAYVDFALEQPQLYEIMFVIHGPLKAMERDGDFASAGQSYELLRRNVFECMDAGAFQGENTEVVSFTLWSLVHGIGSLAISGRLKMIPEDFLTMLIEGSKDLMGRILAPDLSNAAKKQKPAAKGPSGAQRRPKK